MKIKKITQNIANWKWLFFILIIVCSSAVSCVQKQGKEQEPIAQPHPKNNPESPKMLEGSWVPDNHHEIDFNKLPLIKSQHSVVSDVQVLNGVNQHNYLTYFNEKYWAMWSDGPGVEDRVGQRVAFSTSTDGLKWSDKKFITPYPPGSDTYSPHYNTRTEKGFRYISRGFWQLNGELLALVSKDEADGFFGSDLELRAFRLNPKNETWEDIGVVYDNAINNFPPKLLPSGEWMMTRRSYDRDVHMLTGGVKSFNQWETHPVTNYRDSELVAEEPYWWVLPDKNLLALFRDNARGGFLFRAFSVDLGRTWSKPVRTDFPDARSKFSGLQLSDGRYILVSNPDPIKRDPLVLSISDDGMVFNNMGYLIGGRQVDYPHIIEHNGYLLVAFSGEKQSVEVLKIKISDIDNLKMPSKEEITKEETK
ncbi:MAG: exo-alpha-sialidase [Flavobacteriaceae bacterium]|nr:exo-alpha-sialidase [Flavobacteriaceae bacterium]